MVLEALEEDQVVQEGQEGLEDLEVQVVQVVQAVLEVQAVQEVQEDRCQGMIWIAAAQFLCQTFQLFRHRQLLS